MLTQFAEAVLYGGLIAMSISVASGLIGGATLSLTTVVIAAATCGIYATIVPRTNVTIKLNPVLGKLEW